MRISAMISACFSLAAASQALATGGFECTKTSPSPVDGIVKFTVEACQGHYWHGPLCSDLRVNYSVKGADGSVREVNESIPRDAEVGHWSDGREFRIAATDTEGMFIKLNIMTRSRGEGTVGTLKFVPQGGQEVSFPVSCQFY